MEVFLILAAQVMLYTAFPFYFATLKHSFRLIFFYVYISIILVIGGFLGAVYSFPLTDTINISGGSLAYGALMMSTLLFFIVERDLNVIRNVIRIVIVVNIFKFFIFSMISWALSSNVILNPFNTSPSVFSISIGIVIIGGALIISELLLLIFLFEQTKKRSEDVNLLSISYTIFFICVLCLDGVLFPLIAFPFNPELISIIIGGVKGKFVMALIYSIPIIIFLFAFRKTIEEYKITPIQLQELLFEPKETLIQEIERQHQALAVTEENYRHLAESIEDIFFSMDAERRFTYWNSAAAEVTGHSRQEAIGKTLYELFPHLKGAPLGEFYESVLTTQKSAQFINQTQLVDEKHYYEIAAYPFRGGISVLARDITERKRTEEEIRRQRELLQKIFDNAPIGLNLFDENGQLALVNRAWERMFGWTLEETEARNLDTLVECFPDRRERRWARKFLREASGEWADFRIRVVDGRVLDVLGAVVRVSDGTSIGITQDITERKRAEEELRRHREHLEELVKERTSELAIAKDKAEESDRLKSAFLATMSHELRTPLNSIIGFTGIMLQGLVGSLNDEQQKQLAMVKSSAYHLLNLINEVLDLSKIEAGQVELKLEAFGMRTSIDRTIQTLAPLAAKKQLTLIADVAPEVDCLTSDRRRVEQVLLNLVNNAIKFTERGEVRIECRVRGSQLLTSVVDSGIGIKPEEIGKLFTTFQQLDSTLSRKHEGTGLGLAICKKLVEMLGGEIQAESVWGSGSVFAFALPLNRQGS